MAGMFDDLIPKTAAPASQGGMFDALIPKQTAAPGKGDIPPSIPLDIAKSFGSGVVQGGEGLVGMFGDAAKANSLLAGKAASYLGAPDWLAKHAGDPLNMLLPGGGANAVTGMGAPTSEMASQLVDKTIGPLHQAETVPGKFAQTAGQFLPATLMGPEGIGSRLATGLTAAVGSEAAGQATQGTSAEPYARGLGAILGGMSPGLASKAITPFAASPERLALADALKGEGVDLTAGQKTGSRALRYAESELGGAGAANAMDNQAAQFTKAALSRAGINADHATPEVIDSAFNRIGGQFDALGQRNNLAPDPHLASNIVPVVQDYASMVPESARSPIVQKTATDLVDAAQNGLSGTQAQAYSSRLGKMARSTNDPQLKDALSGMKEALDNSFESSIQQNNPVDLGAYKEARNQYRNMLVLEKAASGAGENAAQGLISPQALRGATVQKQGMRNYARGNGDFADLARAGAGTMAPLPQSGTAISATVRGIPAVLGTLLGSHSGFGVDGAMAGGAAGVVAPHILGKAIMSEPGQAYLGNQIMANGPKLSPAQLALMLSASNPVKQLDGANR